jgi:hypothetical protein
MELTTHPQSTTEIKERVELYPLLPFEVSWPVTGSTLPLPTLNVSSKGCYYSEIISHTPYGKKLLK